MCKFCGIFLKHTLSLCGLLKDCVNLAKHFGESLFQECVCLRRALLTFLQIRSNIAKHRCCRVGRGGRCSAFPWETIIIIDSCGLFPSFVWSSIITPFGERFPPAYHHSTYIQFYRQTHTTLSHVLTLVNRCQNGGDCCLLATRLGLYIMLVFRKIRICIFSGVFILLNSL